MKIGILTFHCANNYGAVLQAFALAKHLSQNNEVYIIDYKPDYLHKTTLFFPTLKDYTRRPIRSIKNTVKSILNFNSKRYMINYFSDFRETYLPLYKFTNSKDLSVFDTIIIGSDQVWNIEITEGFDAYFWGSIIPNKVKLISYAASVGRYIFKTNEIKVIKENLSRFSAISVRENNIKELLSGIYSNKEIKLVLDPTFLIDKSTYINIIEKPICNDKYVLIYEVVHDINTERIASNIAKEIDAKLIRIGSKSNNKNIKSYTNIGPSEFINFIYYSSFVVTTSFHGTAFSLILNKDFYTVKLGNEVDERAKTLLNSINLAERHIDKLSSPSPNKVNYDEVNKILNTIIDDSKEFIIKNI